MIFSSESFLFLFLPVFLACYYVAPVRWRSHAILLGSYIFYAWWRVDFLVLLMGTTIFAYAVGQRVAANRGTPRGRFWLAIGVTGCLVVLGIFKYLGFFIDSLAALFGTDAAGLGVHWRLILPIGISFYVFQALSYLIDVHRGDASADATLVDFAAFIALFPQLIAGPILRYKDLEHQFRHRTHTWDLFCDGVIRFLIGLGKKVLLADAVAPLADAGFGAPNEAGAALAWAAAIAYMLQLYFDFSGYSDMAIGLGKMMGFRFAENFDTPYASRSVTEFWRRWHISLSTWLRDYLYIPLGGNRKGTLRTYANLMAVMVLGGLWHGANWTFVLWGSWHGALLAAERATGRERRAAGRILSIPVTLLLVLIGWVMFRAPNARHGLDMYAAMLGANGLWGAPGPWLAVTRESLVLTCIAAAVVAIEPRLRRPASEDPVALSGSLRLGGAMAADGAVALAVTALGALAVLKLAEQSFSPFLYFQF